VTPLLVISFYTACTPYEEEAARLAASLLRHSVRHHVEALPNLGDWQLNTMQKPAFIQKMLRDFPDHRLLWLDADAEITGPLDWFGSVGEKIALYIEPDTFLQSPNRVLSGTIYLQPCDEITALADAWRELADRFPDRWDQASLAHALAMYPGLAVRHLPAEFCWIEDKHRPRYPGAKPVIIHHQASRRLKKAVQI
jgi:hypothetical protein